MSDQRFRILVIPSSLLGMARLIGIIQYSSIYIIKTDITSPGYPREDGTRLPIG